MRSLRIVFTAGGALCLPLAFITFLAAGPALGLAVAACGVIAVAAGRGLGRVS